MAEPKHYLVSFENVSATVGGYDISSIVELQLSAAANGIPTLTLLVDAGHSDNGSSDNTSTYVADAMNLMNAREVIDNCLAIAHTDGASLSLELTVKSVGAGGGDTQQLSISGWMLTDVSLSPIQKSGLCTVALTFMHPICKSHFGGIVPGLLAKPITFEGLDGSNPLDVFVNALGLYGESADREQPREASVEGASDQTEVRNSLIKRLAKATSDLESALTWTGGGLPAEAQLSEWGELHRIGIASYAKPSGGTSVFQRFSKCLVPECSLAIGGDFTSGQLEVGPFKPWADANMTISDSDIISMQFPQSDPSPLSGVRITSNDTSDTIPFSFHVDMSQIESRPADIFYVPQSEISAEYMYGPIQQFQEPGWMSEMRSMEMLRASIPQSDTFGATNGTMQTAATVPRGGKVEYGGGGSDKSSIDYSSAMLACAKAYYETMLMKDWSFTVNTRLMFKSGNIICPGRVISIKSDGSEALAGYVTAVTHTISVSNRCAHTSIVCTHPRFGQKPESITSTGNAMYTT